MSHSSNWPTNYTHSTCPHSLQTSPEPAAKTLQRARKGRLFRQARLLFGVVVLAWVTHDAGAQGVLTNGWMHLGTIAPVGHSDSWTFSANTGDILVIRVGKISQTNSFTPRIRLMNPLANQQAVASGAVAAEIAVTATNTGAFTVIVDDAVGTTATGTYRLTLAQVPGAVFVAPGDEGGPMTNGVMHLGTVLPGDLDLWTFNANTGDSLVVRVGEITDTNTFTPWVRLYGPNGKLLDSGFGASAGEVAVTATNSGTFLVVVSDGNGALSGSGDYRLTLAKTGDPVVVSAGDNGGPMTNGVMHLGTVLTGDLDLWTFNANTGDALVVRIGEMTDTNTFTPWIRLYGPSGVLLGSGFGALAGEVAVTATNSGTFLAVISDGNGALSGSGDYRLTLVKTGDPVVISSGDDGGPMTNGVMHTGLVATGDLDPWTFNANIGDAITVRVGAITSTNTFTPWVRLYGPNGRLLDSGFGALAGEVSVTATNSGTFIALVSDGNGALSGSGNYRLTLAKTGDSVIVFAGDDGGPMTNGVMHTGTVLTGDLDLWTFSANSGDALILRIGEITDTNTFTPWIRLYGPNGKLLGSGFGASAGEVAVTATNSGTFLAVIADGNGALSGSGDYRLTLAKTGDPVVISAGDDGGPMTNGWMHTGLIATGDLDLWTFNANTGDALIVRVGAINGTNTFTPWVRLYGPNGKLLGSGFGGVAGEASTTATNTGTFLVVIGDGNGAFSGSGNYRLTLAKTGALVLVSPGDEGGAFTGASTYDGTIDPGDLDVYYFTACQGQGLLIRMDELVTGSPLSPSLRLYGRNGALLESVAGAASAQISLVATNPGVFLLVAGDGSTGFSGSGTYQLTTDNLSAGLKLCPPVVVAGTNADVVAIGGGPGTSLVLSTQTNVAAPLSLWTPLVTNQFDGFGVFSYTNAFNRAERSRFFDLHLP